jgi:hypothetical protein
MRMMVAGGGTDACGTAGYQFSIPVAVLLIVCLFQPPEHPLELEETRQSEST